MGPGINRINEPLKGPSLLIGYRKSDEGRDWFHLRPCGTQAYKAFDDWLDQTGIDGRIIGGWSDWPHEYFALNPDDAAALIERWPVDPGFFFGGPWSDANSIYKPPKPRAEMSPVELLNDDIYQCLTEAIQDEINNQIIEKIKSAT